MGRRGPGGPLGGGGRRVRSRAAAGAQAGRIARSLDIDSRRGEGRRNSSTRQDVARKGSGGDCWARACPAFWTTIPRAPEEPEMAHSMSVAGTAAVSAAAHRAGDAVEV